MSDARTRRSRPPARTTSTPLLLGAHMSIAGGPVKALERGHSIGCTAVQIFLKNNLQWFAKPLPEVDAVRFRQFAGSPKAVFGHTSYLINLGTNQPQCLERSRRSLREELARAAQLELPFLVLHPGAHLGEGESAGLLRIVCNLDAVLRDMPENRCRIALEITAGQGSNLGHSFEHLAEIIERSKFPERLRVCLDTAHLFAAGYDISTAQGFWQVMKRFDQVIGRAQLVAWHLNDSKTRLNSRVDRHEHIGKGSIGLAPFREILRSPEFNLIPKVLETPKRSGLKEDVENLKVLQGLTDPGRKLRSARRSRRNDNAPGCRQG
ncbi:MAG: deoxyribonuclease IV [Verrucomicrobia bacterium]|nr:deoxyribonuclease IV [Verrucomicrobiota bacterium]